MSWIISRAMIQHCENLRYSQVQAVESLADTCSDGAQFAPSSGNPTPQAYLSQDKMKAFSRLSRSGMTCKLLMDGHGKALLTSYLAGFHARTSQSQAKAQASTESEAGCGGTWHESSMKYDRDSHSWKTHRHLFDEVLPESSVTLPKSGMTVYGVLWEQTTSERRTVENESGFWPTPCLPGNGGSHGKAKLKAMLWPTPTASTGGPEPQGKTGRKLATIVGKWPTPTAHNAKEQDSPAESARHTVTLTSQARGGDQTQPRSLNPNWVEWLMGWPIGWTGLKPLGTDKFQQWQQQRLDI